MKRGGSGQRFTPFGIMVLVLLTAIGVALWLAYLPWRWERTKEALRKRYPNVQRISPDGPNDSDGLKGWLAKTDGPKPVLIDLRTQADYDYSHLPGAKRMDRDGTPAAFGFPETTSESVVLYDAVGTDAFPVAESLVKRGYAHVQVLEGGIFEWANRGHQLTGPAGRTTKVRANNPETTFLLKRRARANP